MIALLQLWRLILKQIKKWVNSESDIVIPVEIPSRNGDRRISSSQQLQVVIYDDEVSRRVKITNQPKCVKIKRTETATAKSKSRRKKIKIHGNSSKKRLTNENQNQSENELKFFAGYSTIINKDDF